MKVGDRVLVMDNNHIYHKGTIYNINKFREPSMRYAIDLDDYDEDLIFVGLGRIKKMEGEENGRN